MNAWIAISVPTFRIRRKAENAHIVHSSLIVAIAQTALGASIFGTGAIVFLISNTRKKNTKGSLSNCNLLRLIGYKRSKKNLNA